MTQPHRRPTHGRSLDRLPISAQPTRGATTAAGLGLIGIAALPTLFGVLLLVGYGVSNSHDIGLLLRLEIPLALVALALFAGGVYFIRKAPRYPTAESLRQRSRGQAPPPPPPPPRYE